MYLSGERRCKALWTAWKSGTRTERPPTFSQTTADEKTLSKKESSG
jgi:hypothetical protein